MPPTCFGHKGDHPRGSELQRLCYKNFKNQCKCKILVATFKIYGLNINISICINTDKIL